MALYVVSGMNPRELMTLSADSTMNPCQNTTLTTDSEMNPNENMTLTGSQGGESVQIHYLDWQFL